MQLINERRIIMTKAQQTFIQQIANLVNTYRKKYCISVASPIIAQAILESNWGKSKLSAKYFNFFGLKCGSHWKGKSVNMSTKEEYSPGTLTSIKDNFRVFDSMEDGIIGYFEFIKTPRYSNLKNVTDPYQYLKNIKADGYATSSKYVENLWNLIKTYNLTIYDDVVVTTDGTVETDLETVARDVLRGKYGNGNARRVNLQNAGYDYAKVQQLVNKIIKEGR